MPLAVAERAGADDRLSLGGDFDTAVLAARQRVGDLDVGGNSNAPLDRVARPAALGLLVTELLVAGGLEGQVKSASVVARVVNRPGRRGERELLLADKIAPADFGRVHAD